MDTPQPTLTIGRIRDQLRAAFSAKRDAIFKEVESIDKDYDQDSSLARSADAFSDSYHYMVDRVLLAESAAKHGVEVEAVTTTKIVTVSIRTKDNEYRIAVNTSDLVLAVPDMGAITRYPDGSIDSKPFETSMKELDRILADVVAGGRLLIEIVRDARERAAARTAEEGQRLLDKYC